MDAAHPTQTTGFGGSPSGSARESFRDAIRYWEPRRLVYNLVLVAVTFAWVAGTWPHFRPALTLSSLPPMAVLALARQCLLLRSLSRGRSNSAVLTWRHLETPTLGAVVDGDTLRHCFGKLLDR